MPTTTDGFVETIHADAEIYWGTMDQRRTELPQHCPASIAGLKYRKDFSNLTKEIKA